VEEAVRFIDVDAADKGCICIDAVRVEWIGSQYIHGDVREATSEY
jgi:hypothetical protein